MKRNDHPFPAFAVPTPPHRYQIFRQTKNGVYQQHGVSIGSVDRAVELYLLTKPAFDGGGVRLWDSHEQRTVASAEWFVENTTFGFQVRVRADAFYDETVSEAARRILEREALIESLGQRMDMAN